MYIIGSFLLYVYSDRNTIMNILIEKNLPKLIFSLNTF